MASPSRLCTIRTLRIVAWATAIAAAAIFAAGAVFHWFDAGHPLQIWLMMAVAVVIVCLTHHLGRVDTEVPRLGWWISLVLMWIVPLLALSLLSIFGIGLPRARGQFLALLIPTVILAWMMRPWSSRVMATDSVRDNEVGRWGESAAFLIMLLALFAFGLRGPEAGRPDDLINWIEIPAILIVFVLAELGVTLVAVAKNVQDATTAASTEAHSASQDARTVSQELVVAGEALEKVRKAAAEQVDQLSRWLGHYEFISGQLQKKAGGLAGADLPQALGLTPEQYWKSLFVFARSWAQNEMSKPGRSMLGTLFQKFVGEDEQNGVVRKSQDHVVCVALDSVYAEVSEEWLKILNGGGGKVIWAVTNLLPTEFAFPWLHWERGAVGPRRVQALLRFVEQVQRQCRDSNLDEYRRVTVFTNDHAERFMKITHQVNSSSGGNVLDNWYVLDSRLAELESFDFTYALGETVRLTQGALNTFTAADRFDRYEVLRCWPTSDTLLGYMPSDNAPKIIALDLKRSGKKSSDLPPGWRSLRDWYCQTIHRRSGSGGGSVAWWSVLDGSKHAKTLLEPFKLDCGGYEVLVLDLLMIGTKGEKSIQWHAAALSNLSFDRTECTIRVVTGPDVLQKLADSVEAFCKNFKAPADGGNVQGVEAFGTWEEWPTATWKASASASSGGSAVSGAGSAPSP